MKKMVLVGALLAAQTMGVAAQDDYVMTCNEYLAREGRQVTDEARARFANLAGSCMGVVERDGGLYMHTKMVVRAVRGGEVTLYLPASDRTFSVRPDSSARVEIAGRKVRPRDLSRGDELNLYIAAEKFTQPMIDEVAFTTEDDRTVTATATATAALPTTG